MCHLEKNLLSRFLSLCSSSGTKGQKVMLRVIFGQFLENSSKNMCSEEQFPETQKFWSLITFWTSFSKRKKNSRLQKMEQ